MRKILFIIFLQLTLAGAQAQDYLSGKLIDKQTGTKEILYDRTQNDISVNTFQTIYKVTDLKKKTLYTVLLTHYRTKALLLISIKAAAGEPTGSSVSYDKTQCGLIFSDASGMDTAFNITSAYTHLLSFTDTMRTYPVLHKLRTYDKKDLVLDPLTKIRIRKHNEVIRNIILPQTAFNQQLFKLRDSLYARHYRLNENVSRIRKQMESDVNELMHDKKVERDVKRYEGEKRFGNPHGKGLLVLNGNVFDGNFLEGKFVTGTALLKTDSNEYCGEYTGSVKNGTGSLKFNGDGYIVGIFAANKLSTGITLLKSNGDTYFGGYNGKRNGYGELQNGNGGKYAGEFLDDRLIRGYAKEVDPFGYYTYSRIEKGIKTPVDAKTAEEFFGLTLSAGK